MKPLQMKTNRPLHSELTKAIASHHSRSFGQMQGMFVWESRSKTGRLKRPLIELAGKPDAAPEASQPAAVSMIVLGNIISALKASRDVLMLQSTERPAHSG